MPGITEGTAEEVRAAVLATQQARAASGRYSICSCQDPQVGQLTEGDVRLLRHRLAIIESGDFNVARRIAEFLVEERELPVRDVHTRDCSEEYLGVIGAERSLGWFSVLRLAIGPIAVLPGEASDPVPRGTPNYCPACRGQLWLPVAA